MEVGVGGEYDSTNIIEKPIVCGVTSLGFDHQRVLGDTIEAIAWHKGGIFKVN
jgi:folylpolyglutamate synthase